MSNYPLSCPSWLHHWREPEPDPHKRVLLIQYAIRSCDHLEELLCQLRLYLAGSPLEIKAQLEGELKKLPSTIENII